MDRTAARTLALAALAILALGVAAATLESPVTGPTGGGFGGDGGGAPGGNVSGAPGGGGIDRPDFVGPSEGPDLPCFPVLATASVKLALLFGFLLVGGGIYWKTRSMIPVIIVWVILGVPTTLLHAILTACVSKTQTNDGSIIPSQNLSSALPQGGSGVGTAGDAVTTPTAIFGLVVVLALLGVIAMLFVSTGDDEVAEEGTTESEPTDANVEAIGRAAGEAADRIESTDDLENEVYRAWIEMTDSLDVSHPESSTPAEFAAAAVEAGMDRDDVEELTRLFEEVRYGGAEPTQEREERALDALRRIESTYADTNRSYNTDSGGDRDT